MRSLCYFEFFNLVLINPADYYAILLIKKKVGSIKTKQTKDLPDVTGGPQEDVTAS